MASDNLISHRLLLLSTPPTELSDHSLNAAYSPAIRKVLVDCRSGDAPGSNVRLDIAVQYQIASHERSYEAYERIMAGMYRLLTYISAEDDLDLDYQHIPDVAVILLDDPLNRSWDQTLDQQLKVKGPVIPLETLASSQLSWSLIYAVDGEASELLYKNFINHRRALPASHRCPLFETKRVAGGSIMHISSHKASDTSKHQGRRHLSVAVGGTFDHLHAGHKLLLTATALVLKFAESEEETPRSITVGITGDELLKNKKYREHLESWDARQRAVYDFLSAILNFDVSKEPQQRRFSEPGANGKAVHYTFADGFVIKCVEISDPFGPTITDEAISALVVSAETRSGGKAVNDKREEKGWNPLEVFEVDVLDAKTQSELQAVDAAAFASKISSTEIRRRLQEGPS